MVADNKIGEWSTFHIIMKEEKVTVYLNGVLVTDNAILENYWDKTLPIFPKDQIELKAHGTNVAYRKIYLKELNTHSVSRLSGAEKRQGFTILFGGSNFYQWAGDTSGYRMEEGNVVVHPEGHGTANHNNHPGLQRKTGHIGFPGHSDVVRCRNIRVKKL